MAMTHALVNFSLSAGDLGDTARVEGQRYKVSWIRKDNFNSKFYMYV